MKYLFLNHKMNLSKNEIITYKNNFPQETIEDLEVAIFPSAINIEILSDCKVPVGSQNVSNFEKGSYTGEIDAEQLASYNIKYSLVGHSERRKYFQETNLEIRDKIKRLQEKNIIPVLCIGEENKEMREETLKKQLHETLNNLEIKNLIIAYEPVYSIGTGVLLKNEEIEEAIRFIKKVIQEECQKSFPILYGGSVDEKSIYTLNKISNIEGFLVGKASLNIKKVKEMMEIMK